MSLLTDMLIQHEGCKLFPYTDTVGKTTIGVGHNLTDNGISQEIAELILTEDVQHIVGELRRTFPWYGRQLAARQDALADMAFNLGLPRFKDFQYMIAAMERSDYVGAASAALDSKWADQVGQRARDIAKMIQTGEYL